MVMRPVLYVAILIASLIGTYAFKLRTEGIFACPATGYPANGYLGYCEALAYGDYDHGAFWYELEPEAARRMASADVLFLGNSRMEFGLSSQATSDWFAHAGVSHFLFGFSHLENETFIAPLLSRLQPHARVYVINVDRFFDDEPSAPGGQILRASGNELRRHYHEKAIWQQLQRPLCTRHPGLCGHNLAFYRARDDGHWEHRGGGPERPQAVADAEPSDQALWGHYDDLARQFIERLPVNRDCIILTLIPSPATKTAEARALAAHLGLELEAPQVEGLETFDDTHLNPDSAQRWSAAFFELAGPRIRQCLAK